MSEQAEPVVRRRRPYAARVPMEERKEQLMDAALAIVVREGYAKLTVEAVAREAGVTKPVVYGAYSDLGALLEALLERQAGRALLQLFGALSETDPASDPEGFLSTTVRDWVSMVKEDTTTWWPILKAQEGVPDVVLQRIDEGREIARAVIADRVASILTGAPHPPKPDLMAHALLAMAEHFGRLVVEDPDSFDTEDLVNLALTIMASTIPRD